MATRDLTAARRVGAHIRRLREAQHLTAEALGAKAGFTQQHISQVERGLHDTPIGTLARIARALGVRLDDLLRDDGHGGQDAWMALTLDVAAEASIMCEMLLGVSHRLAALRGRLSVPRSPGPYSGLEHLVSLRLALSG